jgi:hypothetical protein
LLELANKGLDKHEQLRYLLLENNRLEKLPRELGNLRNLTGLNLDNNRIEYPPNAVIEKGLRSIQEFLRADTLKETSNNKTDSDSFQTNDINEYCENSFTDDVWASENEEDTKYSRTKTNYSMSKSATNRSQSAFQL